MLKALAGLIGLVCCVAVRAAGPELGRPAPALEARLLDGSHFSLAQHRGEVLLINFWATWCAPCRQELPAFETYYRAHREQGFTVLAVSMDDPEDAEKMRAVARNYSFPGAAYADVHAEGYGRIWRLPISFVIDREGVLRADGGAGARKTYDVPALAELLDPLLK
jgi:peroxiredoxin